VPFPFCYYTWFGRKLIDGEIDRHFADQTKPLYAQHAVGAAW
jgi:hypothetical protein